MCINTIIISQDCGNERFSNDNSEAVREQNYLYLLNQHITSETILESSDPQVYVHVKLFINYI